MRYSDEAWRACVALTGRYITDRNFPDKAIDVLDEAGARIHLQDKGKTEKPSRKTASREPVGAAAGAKTPKNRSRKTAAADTTTVGGAVWTLPSDPGPPEIRAEHIEQVITSMTGIPAERLSGSESERLRGLADALVHKTDFKTEDGKNVLAGAYYERVRRELETLEAAKLAQLSKSLGPKAAALKAMPEPTGGSSNSSTPSRSVARMVSRGVQIDASSTYCQMG